MAPELHALRISNQAETPNLGYTKLVDSWAFGQIIYELCVYFPASRIPVLTGTKFCWETYAQYLPPPTRRRMQTPEGEVYTQSASSVQHVLS